MPTDLERLRAARETWIEAGGFQFLVRRPTGFQLYKLQGDDSESYYGERLIRAAIVGWKVPGAAVLPGGTAEPLAFDPTLCVEWLEDKPGLFSEVVAAIQTIIDRYREELIKIEEK